MNKDGVFNNPNWMSSDQSRVGPPNPKTFISPVVAPPIVDLDNWKANNLVNYSQINTNSAIENYQSGYAYSTLCPSAYPETYNTKIPHNDLVDVEKSLMKDITQYRNCQNNNILPYIKPESEQEIFKREQEELEITKVKVVNEDKKPRMNKETYKETNKETNRDSYKSPSEIDDDRIRRLKEEDEIIDEEQQKIWMNDMQKNMSTDSSYVLSDNKAIYNYPYIYTNQQNPEVMVTPIQPGTVNVACGYNPEQNILSSLPANLPAGPAEKDCKMQEYNKDLFTQTIQPGTYTTNQVIEPINSNIGISFTQQFEPTTATRNNEGGINYTQIDPNIIEPELYTTDPPYIQNTATEWNVTDPRFSGYGTSYRAYTDDKLGQTKFYYDDVNAIRMPNYIVRSNIDFLPFADSYGPISSGNEFGNKDNSIMRDLVQSAYTDNSIQFRTELQERLMRKVNSNKWQQRHAPIIRGGMGRA